MQSVLLSMARGYAWHCSGEIKTLKADALVEKFNERYGVLKPKLSLLRRATRQSREAASEGKSHPRHSATLVLHPVPGGDRMRWVLLATGPLAGEVMRNGSEPDQRLTWGKYTLAQIPKQDGVTWTWRLQRDAQNELEGWFIKAARSGRKGEFERLLGIARNYPMFAGIRKQVGKAIDRGLDIWNRQHPEDLIAAPGALPVMTRQAAYTNPPMTLGLFQDGHREAALAGFLEMFPDSPVLPDSGNTQ